MGSTRFDPLVTGGDGSAGTSPCARAGVITSGTPVTTRHLRGLVADTEARRQRYRPADFSGLAAEVRRLSAQGLKPRDIADALRIALPLVLEALAGGGRLR